MPSEIVIIIGAVAAVLTLITAILGFAREIYQRRNQPLLPAEVSRLIHEKIENGSDADSAEIVDPIQQPRLRRSTAEEWRAKYLPDSREPWYLRLTRKALPPPLREFEDEMKADREDAIEYAAAHPKARYRWSDTRETFNWALVILKYRILSFKTERHTTNIAGSSGSIVLQAPLVENRSEVFFPPTITRGDS